MLRLTPDTMSTNPVLQLRPLGLVGESDRKPMIIAGPCSAETEAQVMDTAAELSAAGVKIFRAGIWKPRTMPGSFEGIGEKGLPWLTKVKATYGMLTATEVATPMHVEAALDAGIDVLWIGARTMANPFAVQEIADALAGKDVPVLVKNPVIPDLQLWIGGLLRLNQAGISRLAALHRGFSTFDKQIYRNAPSWHLPIELHRRYPNLPILCDPSHIGGNRSLVEPLAQQALDLGYDGLMVEVHANPENAWSDARQQLTPAEFAAVLHRLVIRDTTPATGGLDSLRAQIDECDALLLETLSRRMAVCREIGEYKRTRNLAIVQTNRYSEILERTAKRAETVGLKPDFMRKVLEIIHEESVNQQVQVMNTEA